MKKQLMALITALGCLLYHSAIAQTAATDNKVSGSITFTEKPKGLGVYGIFEGRSPCAAISRQLGANLPASCDHLKWQLILFRDSGSFKPTTYLLTTEMFGGRPLHGAWRIVQGKMPDHAAIVYVLETGLKGKLLYLLKGDDNVLFIMDEKFNLLTGDRDFSYTLNRVHKVLQRLGG
jgi:hypothetical protein